MLRSNLYILECFLVFINELTSLSFEKYMQFATSFLKVTFNNENWSNGSIKSISIKTLTSETTTDINLNKHYYSAQEILIMDLIQKKKNINNQITHNIERLDYISKMESTFENLASKNICDINKLQEYITFKYEVQSDIANLVNELSTLENPCNTKLNAA
ncbi:hypothetical protein ULMS_25310 [Patiriisocius marinistellae]|uniref:Uncharacterized protein n=1 Tax=Patiriisocius marinistellae TaxID=2494560 RepID=A0A5J4FYA5_9FLAO|nr:hypothetical protein [Patiriisocius marinistellae]GEQ87023.1 hypothetical protein ULMS_25310 [Patiriisocius marinistellae]